MNIPQGYKQTELGIIPEDWEIKKILQIGAVVTGSTPPRNITEYWNGNFHWVSAIDFSSKYIRKTNETLTNLGRKQCRVIPEGSVLVTCIASIGLNAIVTIECATNQQINAVICNNNVYNEYIYYQICNQKRALLLLAGQTAVPIISKSEFQDFAIAIPSNIEEQKKIATALSDVDALIAALDKKIAKKRLIKQGAMQQLLTGKKRLCGFSDKWTTKKLGDFAKMNSGGTPDSSNSEYYGGDIPFLSISDITSTNKYISRTEKTITEKGLKNSAARIFPIKTIMYAMYASLGKCGIANIPLSCSQAILGITPSKNIDTEYLYYALSYIEETIKEFGQTGTQTNLSKQLVQELELFLPIDIKEQLAITTILSDMDKEIADLEARRDKYKHVKSGMMQKLLTGQIRLNNH